MVAVLGERHGAVAELGVAGVRRRAEHLHLIAGVVDVVLAIDGVAGGREQARERVAGDRAAGVADVQRSRRVRAHELDLHAAAAADVRAAERLAGALAFPQLVPPVRGREAEVDEPRPGDVDAGEDAGPVVEMAQDRRRDLARRPSFALRQDEGEVGREVAVLGLLRHAQKQRGESCGQQLSPLGRALTGVAQQCFERLLHAPPTREAARRRRHRRRNASDSTAMLRDDDMTSNTSEIRNMRRGYALSPRQSRTHAAAVTTESRARRGSAPAAPDAEETRQPAARLRDGFAGIAVSAWPASDAAFARPRARWRPAFFLSPSLACSRSPRSCELDQRERRGVAAADAELGDARVAARAVLEARGDLVEQLASRRCGCARTRAPGGGRAGCRACRA